MRLIVLKNHVPINEVLVETPDTQERYEIFVGRSEDCHVIIDDPLISRHHFVLKNEGAAWYCEKLSQLGIVSVNGSTGPKIKVEDGDEIKCGSFNVIITGLPKAPLVYQAVEPQPAYHAPEPMEVWKPQPVVERPKVETPKPVTDDAFSLSDDGPKDESGDENKEAENSYEKNESFFDETSSKDDNLIESNLEEASQGEDAFAVAESDGFGTQSLDSLEDIDSSVGDSTKVFKTFLNFQLVLFGDHAPYDRYQIDKDEIFIGRDLKKCQIVLDDPEVSTIHAVIKRNNTDMILEDLNSSNGTILNGERINRAHLSVGDEFVIGSTSFTLESRSDLLDAESDRLMPVESGQFIEREEIEEELVTMDEMGDVDFNSSEPQEKSIIKRVLKDPVKRKKLIYVVAGIGILAVLFYNPKETVPEPVADKKVEEGAKRVAVKDPKKKELDEDQKLRINMAYELGQDFFENNKFAEALKEFQTVKDIDPNYKQVDALFKETQSALAKLEELDAAERAKVERAEMKKAVEEILVKARKAVEEKQAIVAESLFTQIIEKDPENMEVQQLKMELEAWQREQQRIALEKATKEAARKSMVDALSPGKTFYLKKEWYRAILKLEEFLRRKGVDEDLVKEASDMMADAKEQLATDLGPMLGKARSFKEGQDLKNAYEAYLDILKVEPTNAEALNEVDDIKSQLETRSKRIYREAIIAESLSLFTDAKEKFQEVQQISPSDSEYFRKANEKLKNYLE